MGESISLSSNISLEDLNPLNAKLGNDYISNLYHTGASIVVLSSMIDDSSIKVIEGFVPLARYKDSQTIVGWREKKYTQGLGLKLTWDQMEFHTCIAFARQISVVLKHKCTIEIDRDSNTVAIFRKTAKGKIVEINNKIPRIIKTY